VTVEDVRERVKAWPKRMVRVRDMHAVWLFADVLRAIASDPTRQDAHLLAQEALRVFE